MTKLAGIDELGNTRGTFTTPESATLDRNGYDYAYSYIITS